MTDQDSTAAVMQAENLPNPGDDLQACQPDQETVETYPTETNDEDLVDKSFELVPDSMVNRPDTNTNSESSTRDPLWQYSECSSIESNSRPRLQSSSNESKPLDRYLRKTSGFLTRSQSSNGDSDTINSNISNSIVNAISSLSSSFTSNLAGMARMSNRNQGNIADENSLTIDSVSTSTKLSQINEKREDIFYRKASLERKNLICLTKLIVKDLISSSLLVDRTFDGMSIHLENYFTLIEKVLRHGLKQNIMTSRSTSLWNALDNLSKYLKESTLMSESVRSLANSKTPDGKIRAWIRLAMMQKKLPEYFNQLLANKNILLNDIYHDYSFMLNDEAQVFAGLIIGVNVIDCNFFVKDANFDLMDDIIDLSPYLKAANSYDDELLDDQVDKIDKTNEENRERSKKNLKMILDQKNYLEEWNKRLESRILDLQTKVKCLEDQNSRLEMESKVSEARISKLQGKKGDIQDEKSAPVSMITDAIKNFINSSVELKQETRDQSSANRLLQDDAPVPPETKEYVEGSEPVSENLGTAQRPSDNSSDGQNNNVEPDRSSDNDRNADQKIVAIEEELASLRERSGILEASYRAALERIKTLERDLDIQTSMNSDKETSIMMYEKDIREKQTLVESLRNSLNDAKKLNSDLSERFNDASAKLKERIKMVSSLQESLDKWKLENRTLSARLQDKLTAMKALANDLAKATKDLDELKKYNAKINEDLRKERECGQNSSETLENQSAEIARLKLRIKDLEFELSDAKPYKDQTTDLEVRCREYEQSLEEIGAQLRESRLEVENLKENSAVFLDSQWMDSKTVKSCQLCELTFSVTRRKHHCRLCGNVFCQTCSDNKMELASSSKPVRVCDTCHAFLLAKFVKSSS